QQQIAGATAADVEDVLLRDDRRDIGGRRHEHREMRRLAALAAERSVEPLDVRRGIAARAAQETDARTRAPRLREHVLVEQRIARLHRKAAAAHGDDLTHSRTFMGRVAEVNSAPAAGDSKLAERGTKLRCCVLQRRSLRTRRVVGAEAQSEPVAAKARENVQVDVQYLLHRRLTVGEKQIHTFAPNPARTQRRVETLRDLKHACRDERIETRELGDVAQRYDEQMARVDGLNVHEGRALLVAVDEGAGKLAGQDSAKETAARSVVRDCLARSAAEGSRELAAKQDEAL